jgi:type IV pilus assembly protein PilV
MRQPHDHLNPVHPFRAQRGFTLIEAMVALIVLSVGLLGIAAMYVETLRANRTSLYRTQAVTLASDIADRMRANRVPANAYACGALACDPSAGGNAIADADLAEWMNTIAARLPGGTAGIAFTAPGANTPAAYVVTISWTEVGQDDPVEYELRVEI